MEIRPIDANALLGGIEELKRSPWYNGENGNYERLVINDAIGTVIDLCIKSAPTLDIAPKWISVKDRLPEDDQRVLFVPTCNQGSVYTGQFALVGRDGGVMFAHRDGRAKVNYYAKYWMPLPSTEGLNDDT